MKNSDLLQILQKLSVAERRSLAKFIASPWANQRADVAQLYDFIEKHREHLPASLTREAAHAAVYPGQPFDDKQVRRLMSYLLKVIEKFLTAQKGWPMGGKTTLPLPPPTASSASKSTPAKPSKRQR
ncbi:MAG: hypothetical protein IPN76_17525 [Saprospiraceae bacterium]|nr:hypothetical protein [Saprospiraceae bacterium]